MLAVDLINFFLFGTRFKKKKFTKNINNKT